MKLQSLLGMTSLITDIIWNSLLPNFQACVTVGNGTLEAELELLV